MAALREGDIITLDIPSRKLEVDLSDHELHTRLQQWQAPEPRYTTGVMAKYARLVSSASQGACTI
jgi:dihydroxy-acid dehydratase